MECLICAAVVAIVIVASPKAFELVSAAWVAIKARIGK